MSNNSAKLIPLASYPKSGNTWVRLFISAMQQAGGSDDRFADINNVKIGNQYFTRAYLEAMTGLMVSDMREGELSLLRERCYKSLAVGSHQPRYVKTHDAYTRLENGKLLYGPRTVLKAVYIVRNPLDVAISYANHSGMTLSETINHLAVDYVSGVVGQENCASESANRWFSTWSNHVKSWVMASGFPVLLIRYEDMVTKPMPTFAKLAAFLGLSQKQVDLDSALDSIKFDKLQKQERLSGFMEAEINTDGFFRKGRVGSWQEEFTTDQFQKTLRDHGDVMQWLGYLDKNFKPLSIMCMQ